MTRLIIISIVVVIWTTTVVQAQNTGILEDRDYKFKENKEITDDFKPMSEPILNIPSLISEANKTGAISEKSNLPEEVEFTNKSPFPQKNLFTEEKLNKKLKSEGIKYDPKTYATDDLVYTGYTFNNGLIFPIDLREDRSAGITDGVKPKGNNAKGLTITSSFGWRSGGFHNAPDIAGGVGENGVAQAHNYYAPINCKIISLQKLSGGYGNEVTIEFSLGDEYKYRMLFGHMDYISPKLKVGDTIPQGTYLGRMGKTGQVTGSHLHWEAVRYKSGAQLAVYPPVTNIYNKNTLYAVSGNTVKYLGNEQAKKAEAIVFEPTRIYGNLGTGKSFAEWYKKIGIGSYPSSTATNSKVPWVQFPNGPDKKEVPWPEPRDYKIS